MAFFGEHTSFSFSALCPDRRYSTKFGVLLGGKLQRQILAHQDTLLFLLVVVFTRSCLVGWTWNGNSSGSSNWLPPFWRLDGPQQLPPCRGEHGNGRDLGHIVPSCGNCWRPSGNFNGYPSCSRGTCQVHDIINTYLSHLIILIHI